MVSQDKLIKQGIRYTEALFKAIENRLRLGVKYSDTLESFLVRTKDYTTNNPLVTTGYDAKMLGIILQETNNHKFSRPTQKELTRITIENRVGEKIRDVGDDIKNSVRDIVKEGYNKGLSQDEIADNISHRIRVIKNKRARTIARTEIARTATVSDYVISKERGATHFKVECRNTACDVCKKAWLTNPEREATGKGIHGDIEYSMVNDTKMLPPLHPNCRCVAYFFKKENEDNQELINGVKHNGETYDIKLNPKLVKSEFAIATEDLSDFGISTKGLEIIQGFIKRRFGADKEYGFAFNEKIGKILTKEFRGTKDDVIINPPKKGGKYSTIHYHTDESFRPPSHGDFDSFLRNKNERIGINVSKKETWLIKSESKFTHKEINEITSEIKKLEENQLNEMKIEFRKEQSKIYKIKDPKERELAQKKFDEHVNNEFLDKHNKILGDKILDYASNIKGLKVKRVLNTPTDRDSVKSLPKLKVDKNYDSNSGNKKYSKKINKYPEKVVKINGKESHGVGESNKDKSAFGEQYGINYNEMTTEEIKFIKLYSGDGFEHLNTYLRQIVTIKDPKILNEIYLELSKKWDVMFKDDENYMTLGRAIKIGQDLFKKRKLLEDDLVVVRRQNSPMTKYAKNGIYKNDAYLSTSISIKITKYGEDINLIRIPKGERILYIEKITDTEEEYEVLLPPGIEIHLLEEHSKKLHIWTL